MTARRAFPRLDDPVLPDQVRDIRKALGDLVVTVDADSWLPPISGVEQQSGARPAFTEVLPTLDPPLSVTIIAARLESR
jgi:hypothetical protein